MNLEFSKRFEAQLDGITDTQIREAVSDVIRKLMEAPSLSGVANLKKMKGKKLIQFERRKIKINAKIKATQPDFRIVINKSNLYIKAQVLDATGNVVLHISDKGMKGATKTERASLAGQKLADLMKAKNISKAAFDRNGNLYHGRVKAMADGLRKGGMTI